MTVDLIKESEKLAKVKAENASISKLIHQHDKHLQTVRAEVADLEARELTLKQSIAYLEAERKQAEIYRNENLDKREAKINQDAKSLQMIHDELAEKITQFEKDQQALTAAQNAVAQKEKNIQQRIDELNRRTEELKSAEQELANRIIRYKEDCNQLDAKIQGIKHTQQAHITRAMALDNREKELAVTAARLEEIKTEQSALASQLSDQSQANSEKEANLFDREMELDEKQDTLTQKEKQLNAELEQFKLRKLEVEGKWAEVQQAIHRHRLEDKIKHANT